MKLNRFLTVKLFFTSGLILISSGVSFLYFVLGTVQSEIIRRQQVNQNIFSQEIANDVLSGFDSNAYRKCKLLLSDLDVVSVRLAKNNGEIICDLGQNEEHSHQLDSSIYFDKKNRHLAGLVQVKYSSSLLSSARIKLAIIASALLVSFIIILGFIRQTIHRAISVPLEALSDFLINLKSNRCGHPKVKSEVFEVQNISQSIGSMLDNLNQYEQELIESAKSAALANVARQVAHDIRSPLSALNVLAKTTDDENSSKLLTTVVERIDGIASDLLDLTRGKEEQRTQIFTPKGKCDLSIDTLLVGIKKLLAEKEIQVSDKNVKITFEHSWPLEKMGLNVFVEQSLFFRTLSNLLNNSIEALPEKGTITTRVSLTDSSNLTIQIIDSGKGMDTTTLSNLGQEGFSAGKESGNGLGVYSAKKAISSWGGQLSFSSSQGEGTTATITIPVIALV